MLKNRRLSGTVKQNKQCFPEWPLSILHINTLKITARCRHSLKIGASSIRFLTFTHLKKNNVTSILMI